jgi:hypothetical protein
MNENTVLQFTSKDCKNEIHSKCHSGWTGLGFDIICGCKCHTKISGISNQVQSTRLSTGNNRKEMALERQVVRPECSNTLRQNQPTRQHEVMLFDD